MKALAAALFASTLLGCGCASSNGGPEEHWTGHVVTVSSPMFADGAAIPRRHAGKGEGDNVSPLFQWGNPPAGVEEWAVVCEDPDAPGGTWVHWVVYGIPKSAAGMPEAVPADRELKWPAGARQGKNSWGDIGYGGPLPPKGGGAHRYRFIVYALSKKLDLEAGATAGELRAAIKPIAIGRGEVVGTYAR